MTALDRLAELWARVDGFFDRVRAARGDQIACGAGCHDCCQAGLTVTAIEADAIRAHLATLAPAARAELAARGERGGCAALELDGRCAIYPARPIVCRSHGVPVRLVDERTRLPVIEICPKNFRAAAPAAAEILDQTTLSTILGALDAAHAAERGGARARVAIADLVAEATEAGDGAAQRTRR